MRITDMGLILAAAFALATLGARGIEPALLPAQHATLRTAMAIPGASGATKIALAAK